MDDDAEVVWAKLNGDWDNANYRKSLVDKNMCLETLSRDVNRAVAGAATRQMVDIIIQDIVHNDK